MRNQTSAKLNDTVFSLASTLFGFGTTQQKQQIEKKIAIETFTAQNDTRIMAVYPAIIEEAFSATMDNYRKYIASYNFKSEAENELIKKHNIAVEQFCKENRLSEVQIAFKDVFLKSKKHLKPRAYNEAVNEFCKEYGIIVQKKKIQFRLTKVNVC